MRARLAARTTGVIVGTGLGALLLVGLDAGGPIRTLLVLAFSFFGPGLAIIELLGLRDRGARLALVVPFSLSATALVAGFMLYAGAWSPFLILLILVAASIGLVLARPLLASAPATEDS